MTAPAVASLWVGSDLSWLEQLCIRSFLDNGHRFILYIQDPIGNIPAGTEVRNVQDILPPPFSIADNDRLRIAVYSDIFRLHLFTRTNAVWVDLDTIAIKPLPPIDPQTSYVFGLSEVGMIQNAVLRLPPDSPALQHCLDFVTARNPVQPWRRRLFRNKARKRIADGQSWGIENLPWGCSGPKVVTHYLKKTGEMNNAAPVHAFNLVTSRNHFRLFQPDTGYFHGHDPTILHVFGMTKKLLHQSPVWCGLPPKGSFLAKLCDDHAIDPQTAPIVPVNGFF